MQTSERICRFCEKPEGEQGCREDGPCVANHYRSQGCDPYRSKPLQTIINAGQELLEYRQLRPEVLAFARLMEQQLRANDHKPGWKNDNPMALLDRADEELNELHAALMRAFVDMKSNRETVGKEAADVANFALMIADVCGCLSET